MTIHDCSIYKVCFKHLAETHMHKHTQSICHSDCSGCPVLVLTSMGRGDTICPYPHPKRCWENNSIKIRPTMHATQQQQQEQEQLIEMHHSLSFTVFLGYHLITYFQVKCIWSTLVCHFILQWG